VKTKYKDWTRRDVGGVLDPPLPSVVYTLADEEGDEDYYAKITGSAAGVYIYTCDPCYPAETAASIASVILWAVQQHEALKRGDKLLDQDIVEAAQ